MELFALGILLMLLTELRLFGSFESLVSELLKSCACIRPVRSETNRISYSAGPLFTRHGQHQGTIGPAAPSLGHPIRFRRVDRFDNAQSRNRAA